MTVAPQEEQDPFLLPAIAAPSPNRLIMYTKLRTSRDDDDNDGTACAAATLQEKRQRGSGANERERDDWKECDRGGKGRERQKTGKGQAGSA